MGEMTLNEYIEKSIKTIEHPGFLLATPNECRIKAENILKHLKKKRKASLEPLIKDLEDMILKIDDYMSTSSDAGEWRLSIVRPLVRLLSSIQSQL